MNLLIGPAMLGSKLFVSRLNGDFPDLYERFWNGLGWEWTNHGRPGGLSLEGAPGAAMLDSKLFVVVSDGSLWERQWREEDGAWAWENHGRPDNRPIVHGPGAAMLDSKLFVVTDDGSLWERHWREDLGRWAWEDHGRPNDRKIVAAPGAAMMDSKLFVIDEDGSLWERHWRGDLGRWAWEEHGRPEDQKLVTAPGAAMLDSKLFVTDTHGEVWERHWRDDLGRWAWEFHGRPDGAHIESAPGAAMLDSKFFAVARDGGLWERNWRDDLGRWAWEDHGHPDGADLEGEPGAAMLDSKLFVAGRNDHLFERAWTGTRWQWVDHGTAFHDQSAHVIGAPGSEPRWTIAVMGDGYAEKDMDRYRSDVDKLVVKAFGLDELGEGTAAGVFRVIRIDVVSPVSGVTEQDWDEKDTVADESDDVLEETRAVPSRLGFVATGAWAHGWNEAPEETFDRIELILRAHAPDADHTIVILNTSKPGACDFGEVSTVNRKEDAETVAHELGHGLFDLGDEYRMGDLGWPAGNVAEWPNLSEQPGTGWDDLKWGDLVAPGTPLPTVADDLPRDWDEERDVGAFEGGGPMYDSGLFRPVLRCRMNENKWPWCPVCGREIVRRLEEFP